MFYGGWARKVLPAGWRLSLTAPGRGGGAERGKCPYYRERHLLYEGLKAGKVGAVGNSKSLERRGPGRDRLMPAKLGRFLFILRSVTATE